MDRGCHSNIQGENMSSVWHYSFASFYFVEVIYGRMDPIVWHLTFSASRLTCWSFRDFFSSLYLSSVYQSGCSSLTSDLFFWIDLTLRKCWNTCLSLLDTNSPNPRKQVQFLSLTWSVLPRSSTGPEICHISAANVLIWTELFIWWWGLRSPNMWLVCFCVCVQ